MNAFISYRHTGESAEIIQELITKVSDGLRSAGLEPYSTLYDHAHFESLHMTPKDIMQHAFEKIDTTDVLFVVQASSERSEGMLIEVGYCIAKNIPVVVATKNGIGYTYLPDMGRATLEWNNVDDLCAKIASFDFAGLSK